MRTKRLYQIIYRHEQYIQPMSKLISSCFITLYREDVVSLNLPRLIRTHSWLSLVSCEDEYFFIEEVKYEE